MLKHISILISILFLSIVSPGQELQADVELNVAQINNMDMNLVETMKQSITEFINSKKWTGDAFKDHEKIEFSILINLEERQGTENYIATLQIQSRRPVYNTAYNTSMISFQDADFAFTFSQFANLEYSETQFLSNLTSVLAFYVYMVLAMDYDSFSLKGGDPHLQKALNIVNNAQSASFGGWKADEKGEKNRYWIVENHLNARFVGFRECLYEYHRNGLDLMESNPEEARKNILASLEKLRPVFQYRPNNINLRIFFNAKHQEIIKIFKKADREEQQKAVSLLSSIDPANSNKYNDILRGD